MVFRESNNTNSLQIYSVYLIFTFYVPSMSNPK